MGYIENASLIPSTEAMRYVDSIPRLSTEYESRHIRPLNGSRWGTCRIPSRLIFRLGMSADTLALEIVATRREHHANRSSATSVFQWVT